MLKYRRCLRKEKCDLQADCPMTGEKKKRCLLTNGTCQYQGCKMILPTNQRENDGRLIIDALEGKF